MTKSDYAFAIIFFILLAGCAYLGVSLYMLTKEHAALQVSSEQSLSDARSYADSLRNELASTSETLEETREEARMLTEALEREKERNDDFEEQLEEIGGTVGKLDKLSELDPELLVKYSKVYFLNENYMPEKLKQIDGVYLYNETEPKFLHTKVIPFFEDLMEAAADDSIELWVSSAFRSFDEQEDLKGAYLVNYGSGANTFSADQGYSEHQLGTTIDFTTRGLNGSLDGFDATPAFAWLEKNAYKYGFILSYPDNNAFYIYEPWHWRFVGVELARDLHNDDKHFYDLDQRDIDKYLISIFD